MTLVDRFLTEHPFFCSLLEHERHILSHYIELYRCPKNSYLVLPNELQEVLWIVVRGRLAERAEYETALPTGTDASQETSTIHQTETTETSSYYASANPPQLSEEEAIQETKKKTLRYFLPGDLINVHALTQELIAQNEIISLEEDTQVISMTTFHLAKLAQQQPKIHRALKPTYNDEGYLVSGLPMPVWQQMNDVPPPHTKDLGKQWLQHKPLMRGYNSWYSSIIAFILLAVGNILQFKILHLETLPFANVTITLLSLLLLAFVVLQRYRCEYTLKRSVLHITERGLLGLSSKIKSYPLLNIDKTELIKIPLITKLFKLGGLRLIDHEGEMIQLFPLDHPQKWLKSIQKNLAAAHKLQEQIQRSKTMQQFKKWHKLQPELLKEINYRNEALEGRLPRSLPALLMRNLPILFTLLPSLYYSLQSDLLQIYLTVPNIGLSAIMIYQVLLWARYTWRISEKYLSRQDNFLGHWNFLKIPISEIEEVGLEYLNIFGFGSISIRLNEKSIHLSNLRSPQDILDEIESLRQNEKQQIPSAEPEDFLTYKQMEMYHDFNRRHV